MARKLRVYKQEDGSPAVKCPRCDELVSPAKTHFFDGFDCPECNQIIDESLMTAYLKAVEEFEDGLE